MEGPNNGERGGIDTTSIFVSEFSGVLENHTGEISQQLNLSDGVVDQDLEDFAFPNANPGGGDPTVLQFDFTITSPGYVSIDFIFGADEHPFFTNPALFPFNDSVAIIVSGAHYEAENIATIVENGVVEPFNLFKLSECGQLFIENDTAPLPTALTPGFNPTNLHAIPSADLYDIEFGGFTRTLTRETSEVLAPGTYTIKIVIQDVNDRRVDAGVFLAENGLKLYDFLPSDYDLDGDVDGADYIIHQQNYNQPGGFTEGDSTGDGVVTYADLSVLMDHWGETGGNADLRSDFDRSGCVDGNDILILQRYLGLTTCANRFNGDTDGNATVDTTDQDNLWDDFFTVGCGGSQQAQSSGGGGTSAAVAGPQTGVGIGELQPIPTEEGVAPNGELSPEEQLVKEADLNGDGQIDRDELLAHWMKTTGDTPE